MLQDPCPIPWRARQSAPSASCSRSRRSPEPSIGTPTQLLLTPGESRTIDFHPSTARHVTGRSPHRCRRIEDTMQYSLLLYQTKSQFAARTDPARREANGRAFMRFVGALQEAGVLITTLGIEPPETAATVHLADGRQRVQSGPYAHTNE